MIFIQNMKINVNNNTNMMSSKKNEYKRDDKMVSQNVANEMKKK